MGSSSKLAFLRPGRCCFPFLVGLPGSQLSPTLPPFLHGDQAEADCWLTAHDPQQRLLSAYLLRQGPSWTSPNPQGQDGKSRLAPAILSLLVAGMREYQSRCLPGLWVSMPVKHQAGVVSLRLEPPGPGSAHLHGLCDQPDECRSWGVQGCCG